MTAPLRHHTRRHRLLRGLAYALGGLLVLGLLGWALVRCESWSQTVPRSDGTLAMVRIHDFYWRKWSLPKSLTPSSLDPYAHPPSMGGGFIRRLLLITDDHGVFTWWSPIREDEPIMVVDLDGGYVLATWHQEWGEHEMRGCWLGPEGQRTSGFPHSLPLRRCVQNLYPTPFALESMQNFDLEDPFIGISLTAVMWWKIRTGSDNSNVPTDFIKEIIHTEFGGARDLTKPAGSTPE